MFDSYDAWLIRPMEDAEERAERDEWERENGTYRMNCCHTDVTTFVMFKNGEPQDMVCPECGENEWVELVPPPEPDYTGPEPDDWKWCE